MHTTTLGSKVDIYVINHSDIVWDEDGNFDKVKERIVLDHSNFSFKEQVNEKDERIWQSIRDECKIAKAHDDEYLEEYYKKVLDKYIYEEMEIRQSLDSKIGQYNNMTAHTVDGIPIKLSDGECGIVIRTGKFYPIKTDEYYIWKHDLDKGKDWSI